MEKEQDKILKQVTSGEYKYGFYTDIDMETIPKGLNEEVVKLISAKKQEPEWMLEFRLKAYKAWQEKNMPTASGTLSKNWQQTTKNRLDSLQNPIPAWGGRLFFRRHIWPGYMIMYGQPAGSVSQMRYRPDTAGSAAIFMLFRPRMLCRIS